MRTVAVRRGGHVAEHQRIDEQRIVEQRELISQLRAQTSLLGFQESERVIGHEPSDTVVHIAEALQVAGTVKRVETCLGEHGRVPDVMQNG